MIHFALVASTAAREVGSAPIQTARPDVELSQKLVLNFAELLHAEESSWNRLRVARILDILLAQFLRTSADESVVLVSAARSRLFNHSHSTLCLHNTADLQARAQGAHDPAVRGAAPQSLHPRGLVPAMMGRVI